MADNEDRSFQDNYPNHGKDTPAYKADPGQPALGDDTGELSAEGAGERITEEEVQERVRDESGACEDGALAGAD